MIQQTASAKQLKIAGDERSPMGKRVSMKYSPNHMNPSRIHCVGFTGSSRNACFISIFDRRQLGPRLCTRSVASSKWTYFTVNSSFGMPSLTELPVG